MNKVNSNYMKELIKRLFEKWACKHKWTTHMTTNVYQPGNPKDMPWKIQDTLICKECGKIKRIEV